MVDSTHTLGATAVVMNGGQVLLIRRRDFPADGLPNPTLPQHVDRIHDSASRQSDPVFRTQDTPSGLKVLGFK